MHTTPYMLSAHQLEFERVLLKQRKYQHCPLSLTFMRMWVDSMSDWRGGPASSSSGRLPPAPRPPAPLGLPPPLPPAAAADAWSALILWWSIRASFCHSARGSRIKMDRMLPRSCLQESKGKRRRFCSRRLTHSRSFLLPRASSSLPHLLSPRARIASAIGATRSSRPSWGCIAPRSCRVIRKGISSGMDRS